MVRHKMCYGVKIPVTELTTIEQLIKGKSNPTFDLINQIAKNFKNSGFMLMNNDVVYLFSNQLYQREFAKGVRKLVKTTIIKKSFEIEENITSKK